MSDKDATIDDAEFILAWENMNKIATILRDFHMALDLRENGGTAGWRALTEIQKVMGMEWVQGVEQTRRREGKS